MSNKTQLQQNNETLDSILSNVLGLPTQVDPLSDTDLIPENIKEGIDIWGVVGTLVEGVAGIDFGEVTVSGNSYSVKVAHNLGVIPSFVALIPKILYSPDSTRTILENINGKMLLKSVIGIEVGSASNDLTSTEITFGTRDYETYYKQDYYWIAIA